MAFLAPLTGALTGIGTWFAGLNAAAQIGIRIGVGLLFNLGSQALAGQRGRGRRAGITGQLQQGADLPRGFIVGRYATSGSLVYHNTWGKAGKTPNAYYTRVTALSDLPVAGLVEIIVDGQRCTLDTGNPHPDYGFPVVERTETETRTQANVDGGGDITVSDTSSDQSYGWLKFYDGTQVTADDFLVNTVATAERPWDATDVGTGVAYAIFTARLNRKLYTSLPALIYVLDGVPLYDAEMDDTGTGDDLPIVQAHALLSGLTYGGDWFYGAQAADAGRVDAAEVAAEIAKCRADVPGASGMSDAEKIEAFGSTTVPSRYRSGLEVTVDQPVPDVLETIMAACNGRVTDAGTRYRLQIGDPLPAAAVIDDDVILSTQGQRFAPFLALAETINSVSAVYPEPDEGWQRQDAPAVTVAEYEAEDGDRRLATSLDLPAVPYREQVQRLMASAVAEARRARRHTITLPASFWALEPGDFIEWTSARNGYDAKLFRIDGLTDLQAGDVMVDLTEVDPTDYDWSAENDYTPVITGTLNPQPVEAVPVPGWSVAATTVRDSEGTARRPALRFQWTPDEDDVAGLRYQVRVAATGVLVATATTQDYTLGAEILSDGVLPVTGYQARAQAIPVTGRPTLWSDWESATTGDIRLTVGDVGDDVWQAVTDDATNIANTLISDYDTITVQPLADVQSEILDAIVGEGDITDVLVPLVDQQADAVQRIDRIDTTLTVQNADQGNTEASLDTIADRLAWLSARVARNENVTARAGIHVDEATGEVNVWSIDYTDDRVSEVGVRLDAAEGQLQLTATTAYVDNQIALAQLDPSQVPIYEGIEARVTQLELDLDTAEGEIAAKADTVTVNKINLRLVTAEAEIDSLEEQIVLKVETSDFDTLEARVTTAETQLSTLDGASIADTVIDTRRQSAAIDDLDITNLQALIDAYRDRDVFNVEIAYVQREITARVTENQQAEAAARLALGADIAGNTALIEAETTARADADGAIAEDILVLQATAGDSAAQIVEINTVSATSGSANAVALYQLQQVVTGPGGTVENIATLDSRVEDTENGLNAIGAQRSEIVAALSDDIADLELTDLRALVSGEMDRQSVLDGIAVARTELSAQVVEGQFAEAAARLQLAAVVNANSALIETEQRARADGDSALAFDLSVLTGRVGDTEAELTQVNFVDVGSTSANVQALLALTGRVGDAEADLIQLNLVDVTSTSALVQDFLTLQGRVGDAEGDITQLNTVDVSSTSALVQSHLTLTGRVGDTEAAITQINTVDISSTSALVQAVLLIDGRVGDAEVGITDINDVSVTSDSAIARTVATHEATIGGSTVTLQEVSEVVDGITAQYSVTINNNGHMSGFGLISDIIDGNPTSAFVVQVDRFAVVSPTGTNQQVPFAIYTEPTMVNGVLVPPGAYLNHLFVYDAFIDEAMIRDLSVTNAKIGGQIKSDDFVAGVAGWSIAKDGTAEFNQLIVRDSLVVGAVSDEEKVKLLPEVNRGNSEFLNEEISLSSTDPEFPWDIHAFFEVRLEPGASAAEQDGDFFIEYRYKTVGSTSFEPWRTIVSENTNIRRSEYRQYTFSERLAFLSDDVEVRLRLLSNGPDNVLTRNVYFVCKSVAV